MKYQYSKAIVSYIDILGFKSIVNDANNLIYKDNEDDPINGFYEFIKTALKQSYETTFKSFELMDTLSNHSTNFAKRLNFRQFSDNFYFSYNYEKDVDFELAVQVISTISSLFQRYLLYGTVYSRGAISFGRNYIDENIIFSEALISAVCLEKKALYPRIIVQNEIVERIQLKGKQPLVLGLYPFLFIKESLNTIFINPFQIFESLKYQLPIIGIDEAELNDVFTKQIELLPESYLNNFKYISDTSDEKIINFINDDLKIKLTDFLSDDHIYQKYQWVQELVNWIEKKESKLHFEYF